MRNATEQGLICKEQYAYRKGSSFCSHLLVHQKELARMMNNGDFFDVIMFDFLSAFGLTTHQKLLECLPSLGVGPTLVGWFRAFLTQRTFRVAVNGGLSRPAMITSECPQGTVLGNFERCFSAIDRDSMKA